MFKGKFEKGHRGILREWEGNFGEDLKGILEGLREILEGVWREFWRGFEGIFERDFRENQDNFEEGFRHFWGIKGFLRGFIRILKSFRKKISRYFSSFSFEVTSFEDKIPLYFRKPPLKASQNTKIFSQKNSLKKHWITSHSKPPHNLNRDNKFLSTLKSPSEHQICYIIELNPTSYLYLSAQIKEKNIYRAALLTLCYFYLVCRVSLFLISFLWCHATYNSEA